MANNENLTPLNERTEEERKEIAKKGGIASGKARNEKKRLKQALLTLLEEKETDYMSSKLLDGYEKIALELYRACTDDRNIKAIKLVQEMIGETEKEQ